MLVPKRILVFIFFMAGLGASAADQGQLIPIDKPWKRAVVDFAAKHLQHSAWGFGHSQRNLLLSLSLAREEGLTVDADVLFAAAFLHDMGGFPAFEKKGVDHAVRSAELVDTILKSAGFPMEKLEAVKGTILAHTYYNPKPPATPEETVFRDADVLDFIGAMGIARILSVTERESFTPTLKDAVAAVGQMRGSMPAKLTTKVARKEGVTRVAEMDAYFRALGREAFGNRLY